MGELLKRHKVYAAWDYNNEEEDLNDFSKRGWQLVKGGSITSIFEKDKTVRYVYQLDYNNKIDNKMRYKEMFEEQGWTYINSTFNGWHYFCKPYEDGMNEADYKIYTDKASLKEMQNRWIRIANIVSVFTFIIFAMYVFMFINYKETTWIISSIFIGLLLIMLRLGIRTLNRRLKGQESKLKIPLQLVFIGALITLLVGSSLGMREYVYSSNFTTVINNDAQDMTDLIEIKKDKNYILNLDCDITEGSIEVVIKDESGNTVYKTVGEKYEISNKKIYLKEGKYSVDYNVSIQGEKAVDAKVKLTIR